MQEALVAEQNLGLPSTRALLDEALRFAELCDDYLRVPEHDLARVQRALRQRARGAWRARLRRPPARGGRAARARRGDASYVPERIPLHPRRRVPGHERRPGAASEAARRRAAATSSASPTRISRSTASGVPRSATRSASRSSWPGARRYDLPINYRSAAPIVELATSVIRRNIDTHLGKELRADQDRPAEIVGRTFRHAAEEADWIAREIAALRQDGLQLGRDRGARPLAQGDRPAARLHPADARDLVPRAARAAAASERGRAPVAARARRRVSVGAGRTTTPRSASSPLRSSAPTRWSCGAIVANRGRCTARCARRATSSRSSRRWRSSSVSEPRARRSTPSGSGSSTSARSSLRPRRASRSRSSPP